MSKFQVHIGIISQRYIGHQIFPRSKLGCMLLQYQPKAGISAANNASARKLLLTKRIRHHMFYWNQLHVARKQFAIIYISDQPRVGETRKARLT